MHIYFKDTEGRWAPSLLTYEEIEGELRSPPGDRRDAVAREAERRIRRTGYAFVSPELLHGTAPPALMLTPPPPAFAPAPAPAAPGPAPGFMVTPAFTPVPPPPD